MTHVLALARNPLAAAAALARTPPGRESRQRMRRRLRLQNLLTLHEADPATTDLAQIDRLCTELASWSELGPTRDRAAARRAEARAAQEAHAAAVRRIEEAAAGCDQMVDEVDVVRSERDKLVGNIERELRQALEEKCQTLELLRHEGWGGRAVDGSVDEPDVHGHHVARTQSQEDQMLAAAIAASAAPDTAPLVAEVSALRAALDRVNAERDSGQNPADGLVKHVLGMCIARLRSPALDAQQLGARLVELDRELEARRRAKVDLTAAADAAAAVAAQAAVDAAEEDEAEQRAQEQQEVAEATARQQEEARVAAVQQEAARIKAAQAAEKEARQQEEARIVAAQVEKEARVAAAVMIQARHRGRKGRRDATAAADAALVNTDFVIIEPPPNIARDSPWYPVVAVAGPSRQKAVEAGQLLKAWLTSAALIIFDSRTSELDGQADPSGLLRSDQLFGWPMAAGPERHEAMVPPLKFWSTLTCGGGGGDGRPMPSKCRRALTELHGMLSTAAGPVFELAVALPDGHAVERWWLHIEPCPIGHDQEFHDKLAGNHKRAIVAMRALHQHVRLTTGHRLRRCRDVSFHVRQVPDIEWEEARRAGAVPMPLVTTETACGRLCATLVQPYAEETNPVVGPAAHRVALPHGLVPPPETVPGRTQSVVTAGCLMAGDAVGQYRQLEKIGQGQFGHVYKAVCYEDVEACGGPPLASVAAAGEASAPQAVPLDVAGCCVKLLKTVAIKQLDRSKLLKAPQAAQLLKAAQREIECMQSMPAHPNLVGLRCDLHSSTHLYLVMDYCPGVVAHGVHCIDLAGWLAERSPGRLSEQETMLLMRDIRDGLAALKAAGVVHRDLKPANIMLGPRATPDTAEEGAALPQLRIGDFGFARALGADELSTSTVGTPKYLAPEVISPQLTPQRAGYSGSVDLWAVGCIMFEMLAGCHPLHEVHRWPQLIAKVTDGFREEARTGRCALQLPAGVAVSPACKNLLDGLLMHDPRRRCTVEQFVGHPWLNDANR